MPGGPVIIIQVPPPEEEGGRSAGSRVKVQIEYTPPEFADPTAVERVRKQLQKAAEKIVARFG